MKLKNLNEKVAMLAALPAKVAVANPGLEPSTTGSFSLNTLIENMVNWVFWLIGFIALGALVYGAFLYMTAGGDAEKTTKARNVIMYAILGVLVVATAVILINYASGGGTLFNFFTGGDTL